MQCCNTPTIDMRYWAAIVVASIFGANMGDLFAHDFGLGHTEGLFPLAILFAAILAVERWSWFSTEAFYWAAIVTLRTAATNLADLATHDLKLAYPLVIAVLALLLALVWGIDRTPRQAAGAEALQRLPSTGLLYWLAMLVAGTLGTAAGDAIADILGLAAACMLTVLTLILILGVRMSAAVSNRASYWVVIVAVRTAGTNLGDYLAGRHGLNIGLPTGAVLSALTLIGVLLVWPGRMDLAAYETAMASRRKIIR